MSRRDFFRKSQHKRYKTRNYRNPHIKESKKWKPKFFVLPSISIALFVALIVFLLCHDMFRINHVEILGTEYLDQSSFENEIEQYVEIETLFVFKNSNMFLFSPDELSELLVDRFALASIDIGTSEGTMFISLEERTSNLFWKTQGKLFVVDLEGVVVREVVSDDDAILHQSNLSELPVFIDTNDASVNVGAMVLTESEVENAFGFITQLEYLNLNISFIDIDRVAGKWCRFVLEDGPDIILDLTGDAQSQFEHLVVVTDNQGDSFMGLEYIDLRFGDKVYYK